MKGALQYPSELCQEKEIMGMKAYLSLGLEFNLTSKLPTGHIKLQT